MAASISAVAATCVSAPTMTQGQNIGGGRGGSCPSAIITAARKTRAKGKPNRKRTWVAPTVPSLAVSSRCVALRTVCAAAAMTVKTTHSHEESSIGTYGTARAAPLSLHSVTPPFSLSTIGPCAENMESNARRVRVPRPHIVHVHVGRELPAVGQEIVDHAGLVDDAQPMPLERRLELVRSDEFVPLVGAAREPAQHVFGADDRQCKALERAVEGCRDHEPARLHHLRATPDEEA